MKTPDSLYPSNYDDEIGPLELGAEWWRERCRELQHNLKIADAYPHADKLDFEKRIEDCSKYGQIKRDIEEILKKSKKTWP